MSSIPSTVRSMRSRRAGHIPVVVFSFMASPVPTQSATRPGYSSAWVATSMATSIGWWRIPSAGITMPPTVARSVLARKAASVVKIPELCPEECCHGSV